MAFLDSNPQVPLDLPKQMEILTLNGLFDQADAFSVLRHALIEEFKGAIAIVSSFGADSAVLLHIVSRIDPDVPVLFLDTGKHFKQTLAYRDHLQKTFGLTNVITMTPDHNDLKQFDPTGQLWQTDVDGCCHVRKTLPLDRALKGYRAWVTGRKRYQTDDRGALPHFELVGEGTVKVNPLAFWDSDDMNAYKKAHDLPAHALVSQGYPSIGCAVCTSAVADGEDERSGRWRGKNKNECGIHFDVSEKIAQSKRIPTRTLYKNGEFVTNIWSRLDDEASLENATAVHIPLKRWLKERDTLTLSGLLGLLIEPDDNVEDVAQDLARFASIAIDFPVFGDGRGYSSARLLRDTYGYRSEVQAVGDILIDQIPFMQRVGIDAFEITDQFTKHALEQGKLPDVSIYMQPAARHEDEKPVGTRPFLRQLG